MAEQAAELRTVIQSTDSNVQLFILNRYNATRPIVGGKDDTNQYIDICFATALRPNACTDLSLWGRECHLVEARPRHSYLLHRL